MLLLFRLPAIASIGSVAIVTLLAVDALRAGIDIGWKRRGFIRER